MTSFILRRLRDLVIVLFLVGTGLFFLLHLIPGSPAAALLGEFATAEQIAQLEESMGLHRPLFDQYVIWLGNVVRGDLGYSFTQSQDVVPAVWTALGPTMLLATVATLLSVVIATPLAVRSVMAPDSALSRFLLGFSSFGLAVPGFWLALMLVLLFAVQLRWLPASGWVNPFLDPVAGIRAMILPLVVILAHQVAMLVMTLREGLSGEMLNSYVRTARAKGASEKHIMYRHILPNAILPAITIVGSSFGTLLGGVVILETVFIIPGLGMALMNAITARDYNLILGITLVTALLIVVINTVVDVLYGVLDPRVRLQ